MKIYNQCSLLNKNSFQLDATSEWFIELETLDDIDKFLQKYNPSLSKIPLNIIGGGTNILLLSNLPGLTITPTFKGISLSEGPVPHTVLLKAYAGEVWDDVVSFALSNNLFGIENLSYVPGNIGASPVQNIGSYGVELSHCLYQVEGVDLFTGKPFNFSREEAQLGYRTSYFKREVKNRFLVSAVSLILNTVFSPILTYSGLSSCFKDAPPQSAQQIRATIKSLRDSKLPDPTKLGNAGSFFKNPETPIRHAMTIKNDYPDLPLYPIDDHTCKVSAAYLIDKSGLKGFTQNNCSVYQNQPLVLVNNGGASGNDILTLSQKIITTVDHKFNITLSPEVEFLPGKTLFQ